MDSKPLTKLQRQILLWLSEHGSASFGGGEGCRGNPRCFITEAGAHIRAYQTPDLFLRQRGLIERVEGANQPGYVYRLTENGARRVARFRTETR